MDFCFPKSSVPQDLGCFVVMEILWQSSLVIFLEREKYLSNVIGLINVKCILCNFLEILFTYHFWYKGVFSPKYKHIKDVFL